ncbi:MAG: hypothetical protein QXH07_05495 [Thermoplasmata archaeon]
MKTILVDIDNTLWDFGSALYQKIISNGYTVPPPAFWNWRFYTGVISQSEFLRLVHEVHLMQEEFKPFCDAVDFLHCIKLNRFHIVIASNRKADTYSATKSWLLANHLVFDDLLISDDKRSSINSNIDVVVDDSPSVIAYSYRKHIRTTGLCYNWNRNFKRIVPLWDNLRQCGNHILSRSM